MIIAVWPLAILILGLILYYGWPIERSPRHHEIGRLVFFVGLFWLVYTLVGKTLTLG